ncbi:protochlorophyllide-dependent translocon component 52, chloroplastic isoform X2 [Cryptomeria japonica]|uniref:protochlorophyllide-dependent translocon component 52, chloroplastic isoform X2 n=1 Tax=Cryptomeria japonica TaxID=3369 RepID=UPI0027DA3702|nr:protochlorophyllide-dependent translocon component 52, chloroplastic isoform X2 [Cryptomeria japonica]
MGVLGSLKLKLLKPSAHHSITPLTHRRSISWPCKRIPTSSNSMITRKWNCKRQSFSTSAISQPLTTSSESCQLNTSTEDGVKEDEEKFNWFEEWYPVAPEYELDKGVPHAFKVLGLDIVVWWDNKEHEWRVFEDSCPHRRAPLSEGRIDENGELQCSYHGWCFGSRGECKHIPQAPSDGPPVHTSKRACAGVYPSLLQQGIIWFWPNTDPHIPPNKTPPFIPMLSNPSSQASLTMRDIHYGYEILTENLMDPSHIPYAHHGLLAPTFRVPSFFKMTQREGKPLDFRVCNLDKSGFDGERDMGSAIFIAPCIFLMENFPPPPPLTKEKIDTGNGEEKIKSLDILFFCVPVAPGRSRVIASRNFDTSVFFPQWITHIRWNLVLDSDLYLLHLEEHILQEHAGGKWEKACYVPTKGDAFVVAFRKWLKRHSNGGVPWEEKLNNTLPPTPPKEQLMDRSYWSGGILRVMRHIRWCSMLQMILVNYLMV